jgi:SnoaL-like protein
MDSEMTAVAQATATPAPRWSVGGLVVEALARRDFAAMARCLGPGVRMRALLPGRVAEFTGPAEVAGWFAGVFGGPDGFELADGTVGEIGPRLYLRWRISLTPPGPPDRTRLAEQHVFAMTGGDGLISSLDLLCSGFVSGTTNSEKV